MRDYENSIKKVASYNNHLRFNLHCKHNGIVLASLRLLKCSTGEEGGYDHQEGIKSPDRCKNWSDSEESEEFGGKDWHVEKKIVSIVA